MRTGLLGWVGTAGGHGGIGVDAGGVLRTAGYAGAKSRTSRRDEMVVGIMIVVVMSRSRSSAGSWR